MAAAAFWIGLAAVLIAGSWRKKSVEQMRHETVRLLIQRGGEIDEEQLKELIHPTPPPLPENHPWRRKPPPGLGYRALRAVGTILMVTALGLGAMIAGIGVTQNVVDAPLAGTGVAVFVLLLGAGLFIASRFLPPPTRETGERDG